MVCASLVRPSDVTLLRGMIGSSTDGPATALMTAQPDYLSAAVLLFILSLLFNLSRINPCTGTLRFANTTIYST